MTTAAPDLSVVIVSYRCREDVCRSVASVLDTTIDHTVEVLVVDNDSDDGTLEAVATRFPTVMTIDMGRNTGFARANNRGIMASTGRHVLVLNPDTVVEPAALDLLVAFADEHAAAGVVAPALLNPDGSDQLTARAFPTPAAAVFGRRSPVTRLFPRNRWSSAYLAGRDHQGDEPFTVDWVSGACMLVPRAVIAGVGGFDEGYFLFWEDADWCRRIIDAGFAVWCVPKARVVHDEGGTRSHGWPTPLVVHFHRGAHRYWTTHHAPQWWNPLRWAAGAALAARAALVIARSRASATTSSRPAANGPATNRPTVNRPTSSEGPAT